MNITIDYVDNITEQLDNFSNAYNTNVVAVFPDRKEIYVGDMAEFLRTCFADWEDEVPIDTEHNMRAVECSVLTQDKRYQVFLQDDYTGYTIIGEYELIENAEEAIENCRERQYNITVAMNYEVSVTVTANSLSEAEDIAYDFCESSMNLENHYTYDDNIEEWDIMNANVEITDSELA